MADELEFLTKLEEALSQRRVYLDEQSIPRLRKSFHTYQTAVRNILNLLTRKSLIREDPYKLEQKISEVSLPSSDPVLESDKLEQISLRLSDFESQLDFLNNFYQFSVDFLNLSRVRLLSKLVKYILWDKLSEVSSSINTKLVAELFGKVRQGGDKLAAGVLNDAQNQLIKATDDILSVLRDLTSYQREQYKFVMRERLFTVVDLDSNLVANERDEVLRKLKVRFAQLASKAPRGAREEGLDERTPYYPELVAEILDEDYSEYAENLRQGLLEKLKVHVVRPIKKEEPNFRPILVEAIRLLGTAGMPMESAIHKLTDNALLLEQMKLSFAARLRLWFTKLVRTETPMRTYEIEMADPDTAITKVEKLDFKSYSDRVTKRCKVLESISNKMSPTHTKLTEADEAQLHSFLSTNLNDLYTLYLRMAPLDNYFKSRFGNDEKARIKGIKMEINAVKNAVVKSNQKMHEYLSRREEEEQLKRLGITDAAAGEDA